MDDLEVPLFSETSRQRFFWMMADAKPIGGASARAAYAKDPWQQKDDAAQAAGEKPAKKGKPTELEAPKKTKTEDKIQEIAKFPDVPENSHSAATPRRLF